MKHRNDLDEHYVTVDGVNTLVWQRLVRRPVPEFTDVEVYAMFTEEQRARIRANAPGVIEQLGMHPTVSAETLEAYLLNLKTWGLLTHEEWDQIANGDVNAPVDESLIRGDLLIP